MKIAEITYPAINSRRKMLCRLGCQAVSKMLNRIRPAVPMTANPIDSPESTFSPVVVLGASRPL